MANEELESFRSEVKLFISTHLPRPLAQKTLLGKPASRDEVMGWHHILHKRGWAAPAWPEEYGGTGWPIAKRWVFEEESALAGAPALSAQGLTTVGPILIAEGSPEQKQAFLPGILDGTHIWCQGFSEPGAGSDLASLTCRARPVDGGYLVSGTKIWTTQAHWSDYCLLLGRSSTEGRKQSGITMLIVKMGDPGITVRPIITLDGLHVLNQCFFDDVFVASDCRIGEEGNAWKILRSNIGHERILVSNPGFAKALRRRLLQIATKPDDLGRRSIDYPRVRDRIVMLDIRLHALEATALRVLHRKDLPTSPEASLLKARGTELQQDLTRLIGDVLGEASLPYDLDQLEDAAEADPRFDPITPNYLFLRKASISAGTNEVQRDLIARALLG